MNQSTGYSLRNKDLTSGDKKQITNMKKDNIPDYPNFYVSKRGRVWKRVRDGTWKELSYIKNPTRGYLYVSLPKSNLG